MHILLGANGVTVRDKLLLAHVKNNMEEYVRQRAPDVKDPRAFTASLARHWGNVKLGLRDMYPLEDFSDFDKKVYDRSLLNHLSSHLKSDEFYHDTKRPVQEFVNNDEHVITLISNAPLAWTAPIAWAIDPRCDVYIPSKTGIHLPDPRVYEEITDGVHGPHIIVDDQLINLLPTVHNRDFIAYHFTNQFTGIFPTIQSLHELRAFLK
jgi:hypothetical protein